jgi:hypothetical protein
VDFLASAAADHGYPRHAQGPRRRPRQPSSRIPSRSPRLFCGGRGSQSRSAWRPLSVALVQMPPANPLGTAASMPLCGWPFSAHPMTYT